MKIRFISVFCLFPSLCLILPNSSLSQISFEKTYGGSFEDIGYSVQQTSDGGYIITGYTGSFSVGSWDVYLIKTDSLGDTLWTKTYGGSSMDIGNSVQQTSDGGYIITGFTVSFGASYSDVYLIKTDFSGDTLWTRTYGDSLNDEGRSVQQTSDGGYIIAGYSQSIVTLDYDVFLFKTDSIGETLWTKTYGGSGFEEGYSVQQTLDGGYIIAGWTDSFGAGRTDIYLIKTDSLGDTLWSRTYGGTSREEYPTVSQTSDGGFIISGYTRSFGAGMDDVYLIKTNSSGDTLWTKTYGDIATDVGFSMQETSDGGYIISGFTYSFGIGSDVYLIKTDSLGDTLWTRTYGGSDQDWGFSVQQTTDGGFIITGHTFSFGAGQEDVYLIKTDSNGLIVGLEEESSEFGIRIAEFGLMQNFPNPFHKLTVISYQIPNSHPASSNQELPIRSNHVSLNIYDLSGRLIETLVNEFQDPGVYHVEWDGARIGSVVRSGIYFYRLQVGDFSTTRKMTLLR
jgi:hypothetical protein